YALFPKTLQSVVVAHGAVQRPLAGPTPPESASPTRHCRFAPQSEAVVHAPPSGPRPVPPGPPVAPEPPPPPRAPAANRPPGPPEPPVPPEPPDAVPGLYAEPDR